MEPREDWLALYERVKAELTAMGVPFERQGEGRERL
jgi:hypothetical protein